MITQHYDGATVMLDGRANYLDLHLLDFFPYYKKIFMLKSQEIRLTQKIT